jgi:hypothetical protein
MPPATRLPATRLLVACCLLASLAACGSRQTLTRVDGMRPVPKAYGAVTAAGPDELIEPSTQSRPERNVELRRKSEARVNDQFYLPPE